MNKITFIGATGKLGIPTAKRLVENGVQVKAVVRNLESAKEILPKEVEIVHGDLQDINSLKLALTGTEYLYLNLSAPDPSSEFITEVHGVENILKVAGKQLKQIISISGLGALHPEFHPSKKRNIENELRVKGHRIIREFGVPLTVFHCTWFIDVLPWLIQDKSLFVFGFFKTPMFWTNTIDFADYINLAIGNEKTFDKDFALQGTEAMPFHDLAIKYVEMKKLPITVINAPVPEKELGFYGDILRYFENFEEEFCAKETFEILGEPKLSIEQAIKLIL